MEGKGVYSHFMRLGGKQTLKKRIVQLIPTDADTYVEAFAGSGKVFLELDQRYKTEVLNDLDPFVHNMWRDIQKVSQQDIADMDFKPSKDKFNQLRDMKPPKSAKERLYRGLYINVYSYNGANQSFIDLGKALSKQKRLQENLPEIQERLKGVKITNKDYKETIREYDSLTTFFYLDPPYYETTGYKIGDVDPKELYDVLRNIKGRFLLSYNDHPYIKKLFGEFYKRVVKTRYNVGQRGREERKELLISNYPLTMRGGRIQKKPKMLELFKGTGSVGKVFEKDFEVVSLDNVEKFKPDILTDILKWNFQKYHRETGFVPDLIWASPPCNTFSPLAYPLKERETDTAKPLSERAKLGTKILYKTLSIINYFKSINPNLVFVIENPKGMMRHDFKIKKLVLNTANYCNYGDERKKPTDFFSNINLDLKEQEKCSNKTIPVVDLPLEERYKIPPQLLQDIRRKVLEELENKTRVGGRIHKIIEASNNNADLAKYLKTCDECCLHNLEKLLRIK